MAMGHVGEFDHNPDHWEEYVNLFLWSWFCTVCGARFAVQCALCLATLVSFITLAESSHCRHLRTLVASLIHDVIEWVRCCVYESIIHPLIRSVSGRTTDGRGNTDVGIPSWQSAGHLWLGLLGRCRRYVVVPSSSVMGCMAALFQHHSCAANGWVRLGLRSPVHSVSALTFWSTWWRLKSRILCFYRPLGRDARP